ncbi:MAG: NAD-dependent epimerase/dehydratase family protein [Anaerolineaceae bacterium]
MLNLVTGGTGHIGNVLVKELLRRKEKVRVLVLENEDLTPIRGLDVDIFFGNVCDYESLLPAMQDVDCVFHLAGIISILSGEDSHVHDVNVGGTKNVVRAAHQSGVKKMVYTSSIHAFKRMPYGVVIDEDVPIDPASSHAAYDRSKAEATLAVLAETKKGFPAVIVCPTGVLGPEDFKGSELGVLVDDWTRKKTNFLVDGQYDFVDVRDVVQGILNARDKGRIGQIYILSGHLIRVKELWHLVKDLVEYPAHMINIPMRLAKFVAWMAEKYFSLTHTKPNLTTYSLETLNSNAVISNAKARVELGFSPRSVSETMTDTVNWWRKSKQNKARKLK